MGGRPGDGRDLLVALGKQLCKLNGAGRTHTTQEAELSTSQLELCSPNNGQVLLTQESGGIFTTNISIRPNDIFYSLFITVTQSSLSRFTHDSLGAEVLKP